MGEVVKYLSKQDIERVHLQLRFKVRNRHIFDLLLNTGLRVGELCKIEFQDVRLNVLTIRAGIAKNRKERIIPLNNIALGVINKLMELRARKLGRYQQNDKILGVSVRRVQKIFEELKEGVSINLTPHKCRHTFATRLVNSGVSTRIVQVLLGHADISSTEIYTFVTREALQEAVALLEKR